MKRLTLSENAQPPSEELGYFSESCRPRNLLGGNLVTLSKIHNSEQFAPLEIMPPEIVTQLPKSKNSGMFLTVMLIMEKLENDLLICTLLI